LGERYRDDVTDTGIRVTAAILARFRKDNYGSATAD
jgi:hypothetical protein